MRELEPHEILYVSGGDDGDEFDIFAEIAVLVAEALIEAFIDYLFEQCIRGIEICIIKSYTYFYPPQEVYLVSSQRV